MRSGWIIFGLFVVFSCKAQQVLPLNTSAFGAVANSYFKDTNNEFDYYLGIWKADFQDKTITLHVTKELKVPFEMWKKNFYRDQLRVRYEIKNNKGVILESSLDKNFTNDIGLSIKGLKTQSNGTLLNLVFAGGNCSVGIGAINFKKINSTQFSWGYYPGTTTTNDKDCPPNRDYTIYLPETENLIFTKQ